MQVSKQLRGANPMLYKAGVISNEEFAPPGCQHADGLRPHFDVAPLLASGSDHYSVPRDGQHTTQPTLGGSHAMEPQLQ